MVYYNRIFLSRERFLEIYEELEGLANQKLLSLQHVTNYTSDLKFGSLKQEVAVFYEPDNKFRISLVKYGPYMYSNSTELDYEYYMHFEILEQSGHFSFSARTSTFEECFSLANSDLKKKFIFNLDLWT